MWRCARVAAFVGAVVLALAPITRAQEPAAQSSEPPTPQPEGGQSPPVAEFIGPIGSVFLPGFGQFLQGDIVRGTVYQGVFLAGWTMSRAALNGGRVAISDCRTLDGRTEWGVWAQQLRGTAGRSARTTRSDEPCRRFRSLEGTRSCANPIRSPASCAPPSTSRF